MNWETEEQLDTFYDLLADLNGYKGREGYDQRAISLTITKIEEAILWFQAASNLFETRGHRL